VRAGDKRRQSTLFFNGLLVTLETLADVRTLVEKHLPAEYRSKFTWRKLAGLLKRVAEGQTGRGRGVGRA
jgi:hypothetical protein